MTGRAARLVVATAGLAWCAAALAALAPTLPEGLAAACSPELVLRELLAGLAVVALLLGPAFAADDPERGPEEHGGLLAALTAAPAAVALAAAGGLSPADLLPAAALLVACDLAGSSYLRLDPAGRRGTLYAGAAAALLAGVPVAAYGLAEFGGWEGAAAGFRVSPLLAARDIAGGWTAAAPAALLLVAVAALLRAAGLLRRSPAAAAAAVAVLLLAAPTARAAAQEPLRPGHPPVLVVGAPREGAAAKVVADLRAQGLRVEEGDILPRALPWETEVVVLGRPPRSDAEAAEWRGTLGAFLRVGGRVAGPSSAGLLPEGGGRILGLFVQVPGPAAEGAAPALADRRVAVPHPADLPEPGIGQGPFRVPFPLQAHALPGSTLGFLAVLAVAFAGAAVYARRRGLGQLRSFIALGGVSAVGSSLLFLPGVLGPPCLVSRLVLEERVSTDSTAARRVELLRFERLRAGGEDPVVAEEPGVSRAEVRYAADAAHAWGPDGTVRLEAPGRWALLASVSCDDTPPSAGGLAPARATVRVAGDRALVLSAAPPIAEGWHLEVPLQEAFAELCRSTDPRVSRAGWLLRECFRPPAGSGDFLITVPADGPDAVVVHRGR